MGTVNMESRSQRLQETLLSLKEKTPDELLKRHIHLKKLVSHFGKYENPESQCPVFRDELRLINEEIDRRHAKKISRQQG